MVLPYLLANYVLSHKYEEALLGNSENPQSAASLRGFLKRCIWYAVQPYPTTGYRLSNKFLTYSNQLIMMITGCKKELTTNVQSTTGANKPAI